jgi:hypothetical protein
MGLIGNYSVILKSCGNYVSGATISDNRANYNTAGRSKRYFLGAFDKRSSIPNGYNTPNAWVLPMTTGWVSIRLEGENILNNVNLAGGVNANSTIVGIGDITNAQLGGLAFLISALNQSNDLIASVAGSVNLSVDLVGNNDLTGALGALVGIIADLNGEGDLNGSIAGAVQIIANLSASGNIEGAIIATVDLVSNLTGTNDLTSVILGNWGMVCELIGESSFSPSVLAKAFLDTNITSSNSLTLNNGAVVGSMSSDITSVSELSPESLASSVWKALASSFNDSGTMGAKLNSASAAGDPWGATLPGAYLSTEAGGILAQIQLLVSELHKIGGLDISNPATTTVDAVTADNIRIEISGNGKTSTTLTRVE